MLAWKDVSCQSCLLICSFNFVIISSHVRILVLIGSFSSNQFDEIANVLFFQSLINLIWSNKLLNIKRWVSFCYCYGKKNDRILKNILRTHALRTATLPTPILWTHATHTKIRPPPFFWSTPKFYRLTQATPPTPKFDPRHSWYLAHSSLN